MRFRILVGKDGDRWLARVTDLVILNVAIRSAFYKNVGSLVVIDGGSPVQGSLSIIIRRIHISLRKSKRELIEEWQNDF